jgi:hypothetical protein
LVLSTLNVSGILVANEFYEYSSKISDVCIRLLSLMLLAYTMPETRRCNGVTKHRTKTEKSVVRRASSGIGCSNDKGQSRALRPDSSNAACLPAKRGYSHELKSNNTTGKCTRLFNAALSDGQKYCTR